MAGGSSPAALRYPGKTQRPRPAAKPPGGAFASLLRAVALLLALLAPHFAHGAEETALVTEVVDGDTIRVRAGGETRTVRMIGVDAPERGHPSLPRQYLADEAADRLASWCLGKKVRLERDAAGESDRYGRSLRYVFLAPEGTLLNRELIREGLARCYRRFPFARSEAFAEAEGQARSSGKGLWAEGGLAELRWLREQADARPAEVHPAGGNRFIVSYRGWAKADVDDARVAPEIRTIVRLRSEYADDDFARKAREAGFVPERPRPARALPPAGDAGVRAPSPAGTVVPWEETHRHVGRTITVEGTVVRAHRGRNVLFLNFHPNWKRYAGVTILGKELRLFPADAATRYLNRKVRVRGEVSLYKGRAELRLRSPSDIVFVE